MRLNKFVARGSGLSRRQADSCIEQGRVTVNGSIASVGRDVEPTDTVRLDSEIVRLPETTTLLLNKPAGYIVSRSQQGMTPTVYSLLPDYAYHLKPVGRLDKDSRGVLLFTNDGELAHRLTHPRFQKEKVYDVVLDQPLTRTDQQRLEEGVVVDSEYTSYLRLSETGEDTAWYVTVYEGRNRQIRRTFAVLGYDVIDLRRTRLGEYTISGVDEGEYTILSGSSPE